MTWKPIRTYQIRSSGDPDLLRLQIHGMWVAKRCGYVVS